MRRLALNISLSILAYCVGLAGFYTLAPRLSETAEVQTEEIAPVILQTAPEDDYRSSKEQELASIMRRLMPLVQRWLKGEKIKDGTLVRLESFGESISPGEGEAQPYFLDVNGDNKNDMAVRTGCSTVGNCQFLLFERTKHGYKTILFTDGVQLFHLNKTKTNGYFDLEATAHGSAISGEGVIYHFGDNQYQPVSHYSYQYLVHGYSARPEITAMDCCEIHGYTRLTPEQISAQVSTESESGSQYKCSNKFVLAVLDSIKMNAELRDSLKSYLKDSLVENCEDIFNTTEKDLNGDGINEAFVLASTPALCGHGGNCSAWVVGKVAGKYRVMLFNQQVEIIDDGREKSQGYKNVETYGEADGDHHRQNLYRFEKSKYQIYKCFDATHDRQGDEHYRPLKLSECK